MPMPTRIDLKTCLLRCGGSVLMGGLLAACHATVRPGTAGTDPATPGQQRMYLQLIGDMQRQGAWQASLAHIDAYRLENGDSDTLELLRADALRGSGQTAAALAAYHQLTASSVRAGAWHGIGLAESGAGHRQAALDALTRASALAPRNPDYLTDLGRERLRAGAVAAAGTVLRRAAALAPGDHRTITQLALYQCLSGQSVAAGRLMRQAGFSPAAREAVYRQARQMQAAGAGAPVQAGQPPATSGIDASPTALPGSMLDRFGDASVRR